MVLETCPNVYSLGYLVFAAAGLKQVFGYEDRADTKFTEIFYRGPSDQKLSTIGEGFLGTSNRSNSERLKGFDFRLTDICNSRVTFVTEKHFDRTTINIFSQLLSKLGDDVPG